MKIKNVFLYEIIYSLFIQKEEREINSIREVVLFYLKKLKKVKWETPKEQNAVPI